MGEEELATQCLIEALDYYMAVCPAPRGGAWRKVQEARDALAVIRQAKNKNPFALGK